MKGFTLIELSIVLVIIGLITGGVLVGRDLIEATKIRRVQGEVEQYRTAINTFRLKYNCLPGDCVDAYDKFGDDCGDNTTDMETGCNGDGSGFIDFINAETIKAWHQLSLAQLVQPGLQGGYDPLDPPYNRPGVNSVRSSWSQQATWLWSIGQVNGTGWTDTTTLLILSAPSTVSEYDYAMSAMDAKSLDNKFDDGISNAGLIRSDNFGSCDDGAGNYNASQTNNALVCTMVWGNVY